MKCMHYEIFWSVSGLESVNTYPTGLLHSRSLKIYYLSLVKHRIKSQFYIIFVDFGLNKFIHKKAAHKI